MKLCLHYPCRPYRKHQSFGDSLACVEERNDIPFAKRKVIAKLSHTCPIGYTSLYEKLGLKGHSGLDLLARHGQPIYHAGPDGFVHEICSEVERGLGIGIITNDKFEYEGRECQMKLRYWHLLGFNVKIGDKIKTGELIGFADNTGISAGDHLHFEVKPQGYKGTEPYGDFYNIFQNNGYYGGIDPEPFFTGFYAVERFNKEMRMGASGEHVKNLQLTLQTLGYFPATSQATGYYGTITAKAVYDFQSREGLLNWWEKIFLVGSLSMVGPKTIKRLNELIF
jgi:hypothetical protein